MEEEASLNTVGFEVTPINNNCANQKNIIQSNISSSQGVQNNKQIDNLSNQSKQDAAFDTVDTESLKPLSSGLDDDCTTLDIYLYYQQNMHDNGLSLYSRVFIIDSHK